MEAGAKWACHLVGGSLYAHSAVPGAGSAGSADVSCKPVKGGSHPLRRDRPTAALLEGSSCRYS